MCGRYAIFQEDCDGELRALVEAVQRAGLAAALPEGEVLPTDTTVVLDINGAPRVMRWGFPLPGGKGVVLHARSETAAERPMFRDALRYRRCLIPSSGFYEWKQTPGGKLKHWIETEPGGTLWMAGVYDANLPVPNFAVVTQPANADVQPIHDRMPMILHTPAEREAWLKDGTATDTLLAQAYGEPLRVRAMETHQTSLFD